jgi:hypothetical protein
MKNITVTISNNAYSRARVWAAGRNTSVSALVAGLIEKLPGISRAKCVSPPAKPNEINPATRPSASN